MKVPLYTSPRTNSLGKPSLSRTGPWNAQGVREGPGQRRTFYPVDMEGTKNPLPHFNRHPGSYHGPCIVRRSLPTVPLWSSERTTPTSQGMGARWDKEETFRPVPSRPVARLPVGKPFLSISRLPEPTPQTVIARRERGSTA